MTDTSATAYPVTLVVLGADGRLGHAVLREAAARGLRAVAVTRSGTLRRPVEGVAIRGADGLDRDALNAACAGADAIFNGLNPPYTAWEREALPMARNVVGAARASGALHLFPGNLYPLGDALAPRTLPGAPHEPVERKGRVRAEMEAMFAAERANGVRTTVLRAGDFFGGSIPGSWFDLSVAAKVDRGAMTYPGPTDLPHAWAYLPDLARAFVALAERAGDDVPGELLFPGHAPTGAELHAALERVTGRRLTLGAVPWPMLCLMGLVRPMMREVAAMRWLWRRPHALDGAALEAAIGPIPHTPLDGALRASLAAMGR